MARVSFNQAPYTVVYYKDNVRQEIRRTPPPKLHDMWPQDKVTLKVGKNDDYREGDEFTVKNISPRQPNVIQLEDKQGKTTFVDYYDLNLEDAIGEREGVAPQDMPRNNRYLVWP